ncbi:MAG: hypothetical protein ACI9FU_001763, partial [Granulosicoccus sp.]
KQSCRWTMSSTLEENSFHASGNSGNCSTAE